MSEKSELTVESLQKLSVANLRKYIKELDGEDKLLAETVLETKLKRNEQLGDMPGVAAEIEASKEKAEAEGIKSAEERKAERLEALRIKEEEKAKILAEREKEKLERERVREEALKAKEILRAEKEKEKLEKEAEKEKAKIEREKEKMLKKAEAEKAALIKAEEAEKARLEEEARLEVVREKLKEMEAENPATSKTDVIKKCVSEGMTNSEINKATGYGIKFVCDTVWRIRRDVERAELRERIRKEMAEEAAAKAE